MDTEDTVFRLILLCIKVIHERFDNSYIKLRVLENRMKERRRVGYICNSLKQQHNKTIQKIWNIIEKSTIEYPGEPRNIKNRLRIICRKI